MKINNFFVTVVTGCIINTTAIIKFIHDDDQSSLMFIAIIINQIVYYLNFNYIFISAINLCFNYLVIAIIITTTTAVTDVSDFTIMTINFFKASLIFITIKAITLIVTNKNQN